MAALLFEIEMVVIITADTFDLLNQFADKILSQHGFITKYKVSFDTLLHEKMLFNK